MKTNDKKQLRELALGSAKYFEQRTQAPSSWVIEGDQAAIEVDFWCKLAEDLPNGKKKGEEMKLRGASFFSIRNESHLQTCGLYVNFAIIRLDSLFTVISLFREMHRYYFSDVL